MQAPAFNSIQKWHRLDQLIVLLTINKDTRLIRVKFEEISLIKNIKRGHLIEQNHVTKKRSAGFAKHLGILRAHEALAKRVFLVGDVAQCVSGRGIGATIIKKRKSH